MSRPHILLTNDDGIYGPGLKALYDSIREIAHVSVVAPESEQSAVSHALTIRDPLRVTPVDLDGEFFGYAIKGTPADCVKLACLDLLPSRPDLLISGINYGSNTGINVLYSGTVAAACEGVIMGLPSIAMSLTTFRHAHFDYAAKFSRHLAQQVIANGLPPNTLLNVNVPNLPEEEIKGVAITRVGKASFEDRYEQRLDPRQKAYYWLTGSKIICDESAHYDEGAIRHDKISVTPLQIDWTNRSFLKKLKEWNL